MRNLTQHYVNIDDFLRLTENVELQKYIALIDNRIGFDELSHSPHGEFVSYLRDFISEQFQTRQPGSVLYGTSSDRIVSAILFPLLQMFISITA